MIMLTVAIRVTKTVQRKKLVMMKRVEIPPQLSMAASRTLICRAFSFTC